MPLSRFFSTAANSLQFRVSAALALFVAIVAALMIVTLFAINERLETGLLNGIVSHEMEEMAAEYPAQGEAAIPKAASVVGYVVAPDKLDTLPRALRTLPPHEPGVNISFNNRIYRVSTATIGSKRAFLAYDITGIEHREQLFKIALIAAAFVVLLVAIPLGVWIARISLRPVNELADDVARRQPGDRVSALAEAFGQYEIGVIAHAFDRFMIRLDEFVERERSFTADASHELRTPLAVIRGATEVLMEDARFGGNAPLRRIDAASREMGELIEALLFLARDEPQTDDLSPCRADRVIADTIEAYRPAASGSTIHIERLDRCELAAPRIALVIVFGNVLRNAIQHGGRHINVTLTEHRLTLCDDGDGPDAGDIGRLFERAYSAGPHAGQGMGLYLVKRVVDRYGWRIDINGGEASASGTCVDVRFRGNVRPVDAR